MFAFSIQMKVDDVRKMDEISILIKRFFAILGGNIYPLKSITQSQSAKV